jgi:hypothetical protein
MWKTKGKILLIPQSTVIMPFLCRFDCQGEGGIKYLAASMFKVSTRISYFALTLAGRESVKLDLLKKMGMCIAPTQPFRAALGAESRVCYQGNTAERQTQ